MYIFAVNTCNTYKPYNKTMSLATEIKQIKPFSSEKEKVLVNLIYTQNQINLKTNQVLKKYEISSQQYNVLRILNGQNGNAITVQDVISRMLDKMSNASRLIDKLHAKDFVKREIRPDNKRACDVTITQIGSELLERMNRDVDMIAMGNLLDAGECDILNTLLDKIRMG
jgi:DNA-binding MarR family transcriptional regulator